MARKAKTVIGERDLAQSQVMQRAAESGQRSRQRATEALAAETRNVGQTMLQGGQALGQGLQRQQAQEAQQGQAQQGLDLQRDIATGREIQADKARQAGLAQQGLEEAPGGAQTPLQQQMGQQPGQPQQGPQGAPGEPGAPGAPGAPQGPPAPQVDRPDVMQAQAQTPAEMTRPGQIRPTKAALEQQGYARAQGAREMQFKQTELANKTRETDAKFMEAEASYLTAQTKAGEPGVKARENAIKQMETGMQSTRDIITKMALGEISPEDVASMFADNPEVQSGDDVGGTVARLLNNKLAMQNVRWAAVTGLPMPDHDGSNEVFQRFNMRQAEMTAAFRSNGVLSAAPGQDPTTSEPFRAAARGAGAGQGGRMRAAWAGITSQEEKAQFLRKATARAMMEADALRRQAAMEVQASGMVEENARLTNENAQLQQQLAEMQSLMGFGPQMPGEAVTELPGGQRVPSDVAGETQQRIEGQRAGKPQPGTIDQPPRTSLRDRPQFGGAL